MSLALQAILVVTSCGPPRREPVPRVGVADWAARDTGAEKIVEVGFGIGTVRSVPRFVEALRTISGDGFRTVRVLKPYRRANEGLETVVRRLALLDSLGLTPYLALSDYPFRFVPGEAEIRRLSPEYPAEARASVLRYSNRYPPTPDEYEQVLHTLIDRLDREFGRRKLRTWYFEVGNEPDAPRHFWGPPERFDSLLAVAVAGFDSYDPGLRVGAAGFTSRLVWDAAKSPAYREIARRLAAGAADFVSFHIYAHDFPERIPIADAIDEFLATGRAVSRVVSEWNVTTRTGRELQRILNSERLLPYLIELLVAAYEADITLVLVHKLMDDPEAAGPQLGLFDAQGRPKLGYRYLRLAARLARSGYTIDRGPDRLLLVGDSLVLVRTYDRVLRVDTTAFAPVYPATYAEGSLAAHTSAMLRRR